MWKVALAVIAGFILWSVLWLGGNQVLTRMSPETFRQPGGDGQPGAGALAVLLVFSVLCSLASGALAGAICRSSMMPAWILSGLLFVVGVLVERSYWNVLPLWYHLAFLVLLVPATVVGGMLVQSRLA